MSEKDENPKFVCPPTGDDLKRPFFAYGIFKPNQIAFYKIENCAWKFESHDVPRKMLIRDGVPIIENIKSSYSTTGYKIWFNREDRETAYNSISETEPFDLYEWDVIKVDGDDCNVLVGKDAKNGSYRSVDGKGKYVGDFNGRNDPFFDDLIAYIRDELVNKKYSDNYFYKIQMYYMILWSAIDRYCSLRYGAHKSQRDLRNLFANDDVFINSLRNRLEENDIKRRDKVYSTDLLRPFRLTTRNPWHAINYYYTLRCNVVHRGKGPGNSIENLHLSLKELLDIFEGVINRTFPK